MKHIAKSISISLAVCFLSVLIYNSTALSWSAPANPSSESLAVELLKKSYANQRLVSHIGVLRTVVFPSKATSNGTNASVVKIRQKDGKMRMDYKSGSFAKLSIIDDGEKIIRLNRRNRTIVISEIPFPQDDISLLLSNYEVILTGSEEIAGRSTQILEVKPGKTSNPSKKLWLDKETFLPLKKEHYNSDGNLITLTFYTEIDYDVEIKDSDFSLHPNWRIVKTPRNMRKFPREKIAAVVGFDVIEPEFIPEGYVLDGFYLFKPMPRSKGVHIRYVDGLNSISVFEILPPWSRRIMRRFRRGFARGTQMHREMRRMHGQDEEPWWLRGNQCRRIRLTGNDLNLIIVGDIAEAELQKIADSF